MEARKLFVVDNIDAELIAKAKTTSKKLDIFLYQFVNDALKSWISHIEKASADYDNYMKTTHPEIYYTKAKTLSRAEYLKHYMREYRAGGKGISCTNWGIETRRGGRKKKRVVKNPPSC